MKNLWLTTLIPALLISCSIGNSIPIKKEYKYQYVAGKSIKDNRFRQITGKSPSKSFTLNYENQNGYFDDVFDRKGKYIGFYKVGKPYKIKEITYTPKSYESYKKVGVASWYGAYFHGRKTANGEIYNKESVTAAHPTLPLPSMVRVTNLKNGRMIMARVNDRGPFSNDRIIDLSEESATLLGFREQGTAEVKVELLPDETRELLKQLNIKQ